MSESLNLRARIYHLVAEYKALLLLVTAWFLGGYFLPVTAAAGVAVVVYLFLLQRQNNSHILFALLLMLLFSDSRNYSLAFAIQAKIGIVVLTFLYLLLKRNELPIRENKFFFYMIPFMVYVFISLPFANDFFSAFQKSTSYFIIYLIVPTLLLAALKDASFNKHIVIYLGLILLIGLVLMVINPPFVMLQSRFRGLLGNPNGLGIFITLAFPIGYMIMDYLKISLQWRWVFYGLIISSLILCGSRTAMLACGIFLLFNSVDMLRGGVGLIVFAALILSYEFALSQLPVIILALNLGEYFRIDTLMEGSGRVVAWEFAWTQIQEVFYFGGGFDYTNGLYLKFYDYLSRLGHQGNAHNSFLTLWLDTGIIGLVLALFGLIRSVIFCWSRSSYTLPFIYTIIFSVNFESWLAASLNPFTSLFLVALSLLAFTGFYQQGEAEDGAEEESEGEELGQSPSSRALKA